MGFEREEPYQRSEGKKAAQNLLKQLLEDNRAEITYESGILDKLRVSSPSEIRLTEEELDKLIEDIPELPNYAIEQLLDRLNPGFKHTINKEEEYEF